MWQYPAWSLKPFEGQRRKLYRELRDLPDGIGKIVVKKALSGEHMSVESLSHDTTMTERNVSYYMAMWRTRYVSDRSFLAPIYSACVVVTGIRLDFGSGVAEWHTSSRQEIAGERDCNCVYFWCAKCPIIHETKDNSPNNEAS